MDTTPIWLLAILAVAAVLALFIFALIYAKLNEITTLLKKALPVKFTVHQQLFQDREHPEEERKKAQDRISWLKKEGEKQR